MCQSDPLSRLVLGSGAAEQFEDAVVIPRVDTAAIVDDLKDREAELGPAANPNVAGNA